MPRHYRDQPYIPARDPLSAIPPSRHPFQFWVMMGLVFSGAGNFFTPGSAVLRQGLDVVPHKTWAMTLMIGALLALIAAWWRDRVTGLLMERIGLITIGFSCPIYAVIILTQTTSSFATSAVIMASVGLASLWRAAHVQRELRILRRFVTRTWQ